MPHYKADLFHLLWDKLARSLSLIQCGLGCCRSREWRPRQCYKSPRSAEGITVSPTWPHTHFFGLRDLTFLWTESDENISLQKLSYKAIKTKKSVKVRNGNACNERWGEFLICSCHITIAKMSSFQLKNYDSCKKTGKPVSYVN